VMYWCVGCPYYLFLSYIRKGYTASCMFDLKLNCLESNGSGCGARRRCPRVVEWGRRRRLRAPASQER
jgi:hypothetical protein